VLFLNYDTEVLHHAGMTAVLAPELWADILQYAPRSDFPAITAVCRLFARLRTAVPHFRLPTALGHCRPALRHLLWPDNWLLAVESCVACFFAAPGCVVVALGAQPGRPPMLLRGVLSSGLSAPGSPVPLDLWVPESPYIFAETDREGEGPVWYDLRSGRFCVHRPDRDGPVLLPLPCDLDHEDCPPSFEGVTDRYVVYTDEPTPLHCPNHTVLTVVDRTTGTTVFQSDPIPSRMARWHMGSEALVIGVVDAWPASRLALCRVPLDHGGPLCAHTSVVSIPREMSAQTASFLLRVCGSEIFLYSSPNEGPGQLAMWPIEGLESLDTVPDCAKDSELVPRLGEGYQLTGPVMAFTMGDCLVAFFPRGIGLLHLPTGRWSQKMLFLEVDSRT
jgi:hypothetical protein